MIALYVILGIVAVGAVFVIVIYNGLVGARNQVRNAWAQIDVQLKRRHDLIPNLIETVRGYMSHERETLEAVTNARNLAQKSVGAGVETQSQAEGELSGALSRLLVVVENYPTLKANENFLALQEELTTTENRIGFSRQHYNDSVMKYNNKIQMFPSNLMANMTGFRAESFFEVSSAEEKEPPKVSFT